MLEPHSQDSLREPHRTSGMPQQPAEEELRSLKFDERRVTTTGISDILRRELKVMNCGH